METIINVLLLGLCLAFLIGGTESCIKKMKKFEVRPLISVVVSTFLMNQYRNVDVFYAIFFLVFGFAIYVGFMLWWRNPTHEAERGFKRLYNLIDQLAYYEGYEDSKAGRPVRVEYQIESIVANASSEKDKETKIDKKRSSHLWGYYQLGYKDAKNNNSPRIKSPTAEQKEQAFDNLTHSINGVQELLDNCPNQKKKKKRILQQESEKSRYDTTNKDVFSTKEASLTKGWYNKFAMIFWGLLFLGFVAALGQGSLALNIARIAFIGMVVAGAIRIVKPQKVSFGIFAIIEVVLIGLMIVAALTAGSGEMTTLAILMGVILIFVIANYFIKQRMQASRFRE